VLPETLIVDPTSNEEDELTMPPIFNALAILAEDRAFTELSNSVTLVTLADPEIETWLPKVDLSRTDI
jgi:hypothetical protein